MGTVYALIPSFTTGSKILTSWILQLVFPIVYSYFVFKENVWDGSFEYCPGYKSEYWQDKTLFVKLTGFLIGVVFFLIVLNHYTNLGYNWNYQLYVNGYKIAKPYHPDPNNQTLFTHS